MAKGTIKLTFTLPVPPARVFDAWLNSREHAVITASNCAVEAWEGGRHMAFNGYAWGENLKLHRPSRIVQSWRTTEFPDGAPDSRLEVLLRAAGSGTEVTLLHTHVPPEQLSDYRHGWQTYYIARMLAHFGSKTGKGKRAAANKKSLPAKKKKKAPGAKKKSSGAPKKKASTAKKKAKKVSRKATATGRTKKAASKARKPAASKKKQKKKARRTGR